MSLQFLQRALSLRAQRALLRNKALRIEALEALVMPSAAPWTADYTAWRHNSFSVDNVGAAVINGQSSDPFALTKQSDESLQLIHGDLAQQQYNYTGSGYAVAVIDTGIDYHHSALAANYIGGWDFVANDADPMDENGHGTHVAGIIASRDTNYPGVAPDAKLISLRVLDAQGSGDYGRVEDALRWVVDHQQQYHIAAINLSLGSGNYTANPYTYLEDEFQSLKNEGVFIAAASGNSFFSYGSQQGLGYPSISNLTVSVGAVWDANLGHVSWASGAEDYTTAPDRITSFTQRNSALSILAPGAMVTSTYLGGGFATLAGTSMATPMVAGAAVVLHQALDAAGLSSSANQDGILSLMQRTGVSVVDGDDENDNITNTGLTFKRLDLLAALQSLAPTPAPVTPSGNASLVAAGNLSGDRKAEVVTASDAGQTPVVHVYQGTTGTEYYQFNAYDTAFTGGVRVATGDVNGDGVADIITAPGKGGGPHVRVFNGRNGALLSEFMAYSSDFTGGVFVASGDVDGDGRADIITGAGEGGGPHVRVFSGRTGQVLQEFFAFGSSFTGGVRVASGDVNGDGRSDVIVAAGPGGGPHVRVISGRTGTELSNYFAYDPNFTGGVYLAAGDLNGDARADVVTGAGPGGGPHVVAVDGMSLVPIASFFAYSTNSTAGVYLTTGDVDGDGRAEIITTPALGATSLKAFTSGGGSPMASFFTQNPTLRAASAGAGTTESYVGGAGNSISLHADSHAAASAAAAAHFAALVGSSHDDTHAQMEHQLGAVPTDVLDILAHAAHVHAPGGAADAQLVALDELFDSWDV